MGELESIVREFAPLVVLSRDDTQVTLDKVALESEVSSALKVVQGGIDKLLTDTQREELRPVVEQEIDPIVYGGESTNYTASITYGETTVSYHYTGVQDTPYNAAVSGVYEQEQAKEVQKANDSAREAREMGQIDVSSKFDPDRAAAVQESKMRSMALHHLQYALSNWKFF